MPNPSPPDMLFLDRVASPIGAMLVVHDAQARLRALEFDDCEPRLLELLRLHYGKCSLHDRAAPDMIRQALADYFAGDLGTIGRIEVATAGTPFQRDVWAALRTIRAGTTMSYGALARRLGRPSAVRAVGTANGANPISIVVPCHRVIGADASLTGYGGGLERKRWLLTHEGAAFRADPSQHSPSRRQVASPRHNEHGRCRARAVTSR
jgi:methylated-DNA-[protein]-cysteine S-methyltransferase